MASQGKIPEKTVNSKFFPQYPTTMFTTNLEIRQLRLHVVIFNQYSVSAPNASTDSCINFIIVINNSLLLKQAFSHEYY